MATAQEDLCRLELRNNFYVLTLLGDGEHRINTPFVDAILACLRTLPSSVPETTALITTSHGKFFSNGLDLDLDKPLVAAKQQEIGAKFEELLDAYLNLPMPTIAAVCGHASAGGFIFALAHDHVLMRKRRGFLYMSEIDVKILIPPRVMRIIRRKMNPQAFRDTVLCGIKYTAEMALEAGIVDSIHDDAESTVEAASTLAQKLVARKWDADFYKKMRASMYPELFVDCEEASHSTSPSTISKL